MKKSQIQNLLNDSLDKKTPKLTKKILSAPINTSDNALPVTSKNYVKKRKSIISWVSAVACVVLVVVVASICGVYFANINESKPVVTMQTTCYEVNINPSIIITADKDGKVLHIASQNEDADVVLSSSAFANYKEMTAEECIQKFIEESAKLGYLDFSSGEDDININIINGEGSDKLSKLASQLESKVQNYLRESDILAYVNATATAVKEFVEQRGWTFLDNNLDNYLELIESESKYTCSDSVIESMLQELEESIQLYLERLQNIIDLFDKLDKLNMDIKNSCGKDYWECKLIEDSLLLSKDIDENTRNLIAQADTVIAELGNYDITVTSSISLQWQMLEYDIIDMIKDLYERLKEDLSNSLIIDMLIDTIESIDLGFDLDFYKGIEEDIKAYYNEVVLVLKNLYEERIEKFFTIFEDRPSISDKDYDEYLSSKNQ